MEESVNAPSRSVIHRLRCNGDNELFQTTVGTGSSAATSLDYYDPNGHLFCSVPANAFAASSYDCPSWQKSWIDTRRGCRCRPPLRSGWRRAREASER